MKEEEVSRVGSFLLYVVLVVFFFVLLCNNGATIGNLTEGVQSLGTWGSIIFWLLMILAYLSVMGLLTNIWSLGAFFWELSNFSLILISVVVIVLMIFSKIGG